MRESVLRPHMVIWAYVGSSTGSTPKPAVWGRYFTGCISISMAAGKFSIHRYYCYQLLHYLAEISSKFIATNRCRRFMPHYTFSECCLMGFPIPQNVRDCVPDQKLVSRCVCYVAGVTPHFVNLEPLSVFHLQTFIYIYQYIKIIFYKKR